MANEATRPPRRLMGSTRVRLLGWYVLLLAIAIAASVLLLRQILIDRLADEVGAALRQEAEEVRVLAAGRDPETSRPFAGDAAAVFDTFLRRNIPHEGEALFTFVDGVPFEATPGAPVALDQDPALVARWANLTESERGRLDSEAGEVQYLAVPLREDGTTRGVFVVTNFTADERAEVDNAVATAALVAGSVLVLASIAAWVVAGRVLSPLVELTDTAKAITETDLTGRIPVRGSDDIAELTATFNAMLDRLEAAFDTQRAFVDDAGHELRTPITIIRGHLEVMGDDPDERREAVELVTDELERMTRIVNDLLLLAKAERPGFLEPAPVDVESLTREVHAKVSGLADRDWRVDATADAWVSADRQRLTQALVNLATNAVEHTAPDDTIGVGSAATDGVVRLWVRDTGPGIPRHEQQRIFERFARAGGASRRSDGAGLGLAIVQAIVDAHGGRVELDSRPGEGARFTIVLPATGGPARWHAS